MLTEFESLLELLGAVVKQAIFDTQFVKTHKGTKHCWTETRNLYNDGLDAENFLTTERFDEWCGYWNLSPEYVKKKILNLDVMYKITRKKENIWKSKQKKLI